MTLSAQIIALNQQLDFENDGKVRIILVLRLPGGRTIPAAVDEEHLQTVVEAYAENRLAAGGPPVPPASVIPEHLTQGLVPRSGPSPAEEPAPFPPPEAPMDEPWSVDPDYDDGTGTVRTFGGTPSPSSVTAFQEPPKRTDPYPTTVSYGVPAKKVASDEAGYPILVGGMDPAHVVGGKADEADEDGVGPL